MNTFSKKHSRLSTAWTVIFTILTYGCSGGPIAPTTDLPEPKVYTFGTPTNFGVTPLDKGALVAFDRNPAAASYKVYFGTSDAMTGLGIEGSDPSPMAVTANTLYLSGLTNGVTYYFAATAINVDGTESAQTATLTVVPAEPPAGEKQKTVNVDLSICFNGKNVVEFANGKAELIEHSSGAPYPGEDGGCDIEGIQMHVTNVDGDDDIDVNIPTAAPWGPNSIGHTLTMALPNYVEGSQIVIVGLNPISKKCSIWSSENWIYIQAAPDETGVMNRIDFNADDCGDGNAINYTGDDAVHFQMIYTALE